MDRVLLVKTSSLGDVIHNLPVVSDIHRQFPNAKIDWVVEETLSFIPKMHPDVNNVIEVALRRWRKNLLAPSTWKAFRQFRNQLGSTHYDAVIDTQGLFKSALLAKWANGTSFGQDRKSAREPLAAMMYQTSFDIPRDQHAVERNRRLVAMALGYEVPQGLADYGISIGDAKRPDFVPEKDYVFILHGTARPSKRWPEQNWQNLIDQLEQQGLQVVAGWGSQEELKISRSLAEKNHVVVYPENRLNIQETAAVILHAKAVIGVDTGFSHFAAALGVPVVGIYMDTDPGLSGVHGSGKAPAINVGNINRLPDVNEILQAVKKLGQEQ